MYYFSPRQMMIALIGTGILCRLILAHYIGLGVDESYVAAVSRVFSLSYFDHPPFHFWLVKLAALSGSENGMVLRLPFILLFAATTWLMYRIGAKLFGEWAGVYAALILNVSAVFSLSTGSWILPDGPLMFFMLAAVRILVYLFFPVRQDSPWGWWLLCGVLLGLGMLSKYHAVFVFAGTFLFLLTNRERRFFLSTAGPYLAVLAAAAVFLPVVLWNQEHGWVSFLFQSGRGAVKGFFPANMLANLAGQAVWVLPWVWLPLVWLLFKGGVDYFRGVGKKSLQEKVWFFCSLAVGPIALFTLAALGGAQGLFHWQAPGYLMLFPVLGRAVAKGFAARRQAVVWWLRGTVAVFAVLVFVLGSQTADGWLKQAVPQWFEAGDPTLEALDWRELPDYLREKDYQRAGNLFIIAPNWIDAGKIDYIMGGSLPVLCLSGEPHHFAFLHNQREWKGHDALLIGRKLTMDETVAAYRHYFSDIEKVGTVAITRGEHAEIELAVYYGHNYSGTYPLPY